MHPATGSVPTADERLGAGNSGAASSNGEQTVSVQGSSTRSGRRSSVRTKVMAGVVVAGLAAVTVGALGMQATRGLGAAADNADRLSKLTQQLDQIKFYDA